MTTILSIQSSVAYGHVGNSAAAFTLMRMGVETYPVFTVHYSNTTAYGSWRGPVLAPGDVLEVVRGVDDRGVLSGVDGVLTGFQGSQEMGNTILEAVALTKSRNPQALYCADPVMGDVGRGMYVAAGIPEFLRDKVVPAADVVTPNQYELDFLTGRETHTLADLLGAVDSLIATGPKTVLVTSAIADDAPANSVSMVAATSDEAWLVSTPLIDQAFTGSGDVTSAAFFAVLLATGRLDEALAHTAGIVYSILDATAKAGQRELALVAAQDAIVNPTHTFEVSRIR
ncbi:MAG: pyridoxal kinase PdxY [Propionibacteriaceae bacterium]|jgi:pyridoxine kinase|nr:pyridoxal kinase PdxY [Propionibacteriaceae bacterium]